MSRQPLPPDSLPETVYDLPPRKAKPRTASPLPPLWAVALTVMFALSMAGCLIGALLALGNRTAATSGNQPVILITTAPTQVSPLGIQMQTTPPPETNSSAASVPAEDIQLMGPTLVPTPTLTPTPTSIGIGSTVIVASNGARVRLEPGINTAVVEVVNYGQGFIVTDGPRQADDLTWWKVNDPFSGLTGWIAANDGTRDLLEVIP
jgi:hypothetical protein